MQSPLQDSQNKGRILLIEDYEANITFLTLLIEMAGYDYEVARTGEEALSLLQQKPYNLVMLDLNLPDMDGFQLCENYFKQAREVSSPIIGISAADMTPTLKEKCTNAGMEAVYAKDLQIDSVQKICDTHSA